MSKILNSCLLASSLLLTSSVVIAADKPTAAPVEVIISAEPQAIEEKITTEVKEEASTEAPKTKKTKKTKKFKRCGTESPPTEPEQKTN